MDRQQRIVDLRKADVRFMPVPRLAARMSALEEAATTVARTGVVAIVADVIADLVAVHPFREGNGRTVTAQSAALDRRAGLPFDLRGIDRATWMGASRTAMAAADDGRGVAEWIHVTGPGRPRLVERRRSGHHRPRAPPRHLHPGSRVSPADHSHRRGDSASWTVVPRLSSADTTCAATRPRDVP
ncbi:MAG: Fic family protein [Rhodococcus sp. (in: high G+C Gram-positive bacteria)]|uniref:Fic family protein n=1 Tax=Rhodococcus sp. TaxID=1831 RepID=UPI003BB535C7